MKKYFYDSISVILIAIMITSCKDSTTDVDKNTTNDFLFRVIVKGSNGQPVQGLRVSAYNDLTKSRIGKIQNFTIANKTSSLSTLNFALSKECRATLSVFELDGKIQQQPIKNERLHAGLYSVNLQFKNKSAGTRVYKVVLNAVDDTTNAEFFRDSIYITLWQIDASVSILGHTNSTGVFETTDSLAFPNLFELPPMIMTSEAGPDTIGAFTIPNDIVITIVDTVSKKSESYARQVNGGKNEFELIWSTSTNSIYPNTGLLQKYSVSFADSVRRDSVTAPNATRLFQNYPNPFN